MITHAVLFRLRERTPENIEKAHLALSGLKSKIPFLKSLEAGVDFKHSERSYDIALAARFDNIASLDSYHNHPAHVEAVKYIATVRESAIAVDYEIE